MESNTKPSKQSNASTTMAPSISDQIATLPEIPGTERSMSNDSFRQTLDTLQIAPPSFKRQRTASNNSLLGSLGGGSIAFPRMVKRQRTGSGDSLLGRTFHFDGLDLDGFDVDDGAKGLLVGAMGDVIREEIEKWAPSTGCVGGERIKSSEWVADFLRTETKAEPQQPQQEEPNEEEEEKPAQSDQQEKGKGPLAPPAAVSDDEGPTEGSIDPTTLEILQTMEDAETTLPFRPDDVLFGRGGLSNHHVGNKRYRAEADKLKPEYRNEKTTKREKTSIRNRLVDIVHGYGGRFLQQNEDKGWDEVPLRQARRKASQALREDAKRKKKPTD